MQTYEIHPDQHAILSDGEDALGRIDRHETFHDWVRVGRSASMLREVAMTKAGTDDIDSHAYRTALRSVKPSYPKLAALNKTESSHAVWLWDHHDDLERWHRSLPANQARKLNHPSTIWRKNPLGEYREKKIRTSRTEAADVVKDATLRMQEVLDRVEVATAVNPGLDLSTPEMVEASGSTLVDYYGVKDIAALLATTAPRVGMTVIAADNDPAALARQLFDRLEPEQRRPFLTVFSELLKADERSTSLRKKIQRSTRHTPRDHA